jgi:hypothetical protein
MNTPTKTTLTTLIAMITPATLVQDLQMPDLSRCGGVLGHINGLAEDGEWHCHLPEGHDGVCRAPDGTTW